MEAVKVKILMIAPEYPPHNIGGGGVVVQEIAQHLKGHEVTVLAGYYKTKSLFESVKEEKDGKIRLLWLPLIPTPNASFQLKTIMPPNLRSAYYLFRFFKKENFDTIHMHGYGHFLIDYASILCWLFGKKYILTIHGLPRTPKERGGTISKVYNIYNRTIGKITLKQAEKITAISKSIKSELEKTYDVPVNKIVIIPNGIDVAKYCNVKNSKEFRKKYQIPISNSIILSIGRLAESKGFQYLLKAMPKVLKQNPNTTLVLLGRDEGYKEELISIADKLNIQNNVIFTGFIDFENKKRALKEAGIFVIPSLVEPFGLVALEAMAFGKPIISTNVDGLKEFIEHKKTGILIDPQNSYALELMINRILKSPRTQKELSKNCIHEIQNYDWDRSMREYISVMKTVSV